ncbi:MAG TPA: glucoamylase family protein, partial [Thiolinea sp.]|nr:glucoamylase family protein [Thiolinea sp.]
HDFGYITTQQLLERTHNTLQTLQQLTRYQGHFYNWYDTRTLQALNPLYVSTVDSGNLVGHLLTLQSGLRQLGDQPIVTKQWLLGLQDSLQLLLETKPQVEGLQALAPQLSAFLAQANFSLSSLANQLASFKTVLSTVQDELLEGTPEQQALYQELVEHCDALLDELQQLAPNSASNNESVIPSLCQVGTEQATTRLELLESLAAQIDDLTQVQYDFLYDKKRRLFAVGYNVESKQRDNSYYDLLASEARLSNFVAIAQGQVPQDSWFALGRSLVNTTGEPTLLSWSGSMFEYLMPLLVMPTYPNTLLDQTYQTMVQRQIAYATSHHVPWGISESGYSNVDAYLNYQYRAFGVPGLGLERGLAEDLVISPYSSLLAAMIKPQAAYHNLQDLSAQGLLGHYGFYEAIDYTEARQRRGEKSEVIQSYMAHHQGMSLLAMAYLLLDQPMQKRFNAVPMFQATLLLLEERLPKFAPLHTQADEVAEVLLASSQPDAPIRVLTNPNTAQADVQLLSNGRYHVMVTSAGGGYSRYREIALTRWQEDSTRDNWGSFCYIRDLHNGEYWSGAFQPSLKPSRHYEAIFSEGRAEFRRSDHGLDLHWDMVISPEDDIELRRLKITNRSAVARSLEITSYAEVVLAPAIADALHLAFSKLFVQTEILDPLETILCHRRPRSSTEQALWLFHLMTVHN